GGWSPQIQPGLLEPRPTRVPAPCDDPSSAYRALTSSGGPFQVASTHMCRHTGCPRAGPSTPRDFRHTVWALPLSLAATQGISFDFSSSGYLDVSVPRVGLPYLDS